MQYAHARGAPLTIQRFHIRRWIVFELFGINGFCVRVPEHCRCDAPLSVPSPFHFSIAFNRLN